MCLHAHGTCCVVCAHGPLANGSQVAFILFGVSLWHHSSFLHAKDAAWV